MALMTGGSPRTMGVNYDVAYDRALNPPLDQTGNGCQGGPERGRTPTGTSTEFDEGININAGDGAPNTGANPDVSQRRRAERRRRDQLDRIRPAWYATRIAIPVYPWNFVRVNTIFGVIHGAGGYTAWSDKHPSYSSVGGPSGPLTPPVRT